MNLRRIVSEFIGTAAIVLAPCVASATAKAGGSTGSLLEAAIVSGLIVLAMIYALGPISGAHFNPAVTIGLCVVGKFSWKEATTYIPAQLIGGVGGAGIVAALYGPGHGLHVPHDPTALLSNLSLEMIITFLLMFVIMSIATEDRHPTISGLAIGFTVIVGVLIGGPVTGGSMNPARSLGPAVFAPLSAMPTLWIYFVGPVTGSILAAITYHHIRNKHQDQKGLPSS